MNGLEVRNVSFNDDNVCLRKRLGRAFDRSLLSALYVHLQKIGTWQLR